MADAGIRIGDLRPALTPNRGGDGITDSIGRAFVNGMMNQISSGQAFGASPVNQVRELVGVVKDVDELDERREKRKRARLEEELEDLRDEIRRSRRGGGDDSLTSKLLQGILESNATMYKTMMESQAAQYQATIDRLAEKTEPSEFQQFLMSMGQQYMQGLQHRDPRKEYEEERAYWEDRLGSGNVSRSEEMAFKKWLKEKEWEIENNRDERQTQAQIREQEERTKQLQALAEAASAFVSRRSDGPGPAETPTAAPAAPPGLYRYACAECGHEWLQTTLDTTLICPKCQARLTVETPHDAS